MLVPALFLALFAGVIGGGVFYMTREPVEAVRAQLEEIRDGRLDAAYARLTRSYQARLTREAFAQMVEKHPALRDNADASFWNRSLVNGELRLSGTLTARSGSALKIDYELVREDGRWKIRSIRFPANE